MNRKSSLQARSPRAESERRFDIAPFALPATPGGELRFEETRDIESVVVRYKGRPPVGASLEYLRRHWPQQRFESNPDQDIIHPARLGWSGIDDQFTGRWQRAATQTRRIDAHTVEFSFLPLRQERFEYPDPKSYNVTFRRTLGIRLVAPDVTAIQSIKVFTRSSPAHSNLTVELDAGVRTRVENIRIDGYNARILRVKKVAGVRVKDGAVIPGVGKSRRFEIGVVHMLPAFRYAHDQGLLTFQLGDDAFTISLAALACEGPIWFADRGIYIYDSHAPLAFRDYLERNKDLKTVNADVRAHAEQSFTAALRGQPSPHPVPFVTACREAPEKFRVETQGDISIGWWHHLWQQLPEAERSRNPRSGRFLFGLDHWIVESRRHDPFPMLAWNLTFRSGAIRLEERVLATPIARSVREAAPAPEALTAALVRFRLTNTGDAPETARLSVAYSPVGSFGLDTNVARDRLRFEKGWLAGQNEGGWTYRAFCETTMTAGVTQPDSACFFRLLAPAESCDLVLKIPFKAVTSHASRALVAALDFDDCDREMTAWWKFQPRGCRLNTPEPRINEIDAGHVPIVFMSDVALPGGFGLVNTSVGAGMYLNYTNEACMILEDLDQRGLHGEVRRRLGTWLKYQSTVGLVGSYTDHDGVFFGAAGGECGGNYGQHHGWALWYLAEHYFITRDAKWFARIANAVIKGADWVFRQRRNTLADLPASRGWERGFLPAGALEDVADYFYWLSTNSLTWRGVNAAAAALEAVNHPEAKRIRAEADVYRKDLVRGFEISRQYSPLVRLRDGRWIPHYPSRLYNRGRDHGWIREVLEGSIYLLLSGLYPHGSRQAQWILDDYQDTRYLPAPFGYRPQFAAQSPTGDFVPVRESLPEWFNEAGFSFQPNLLAGLLPHLDRDEPEIYIWMFFNAFASCYREEVGALVEHPIPRLGFNNLATMKTSDQANALKWLRYMFVYAPERGLYLGRAIPRAWFAAGRQMEIENTATRFGKVSLKYTPQIERGCIMAEAVLALRTPLPPAVLRFRHPAGAPIRNVFINGNPVRASDRIRGDVDITGMNGRLKVEARYGDST